MTEFNRELVTETEKIIKENPFLHSRVAVARAKNNLKIEPTGEDLAKLGNVEFTTHQTKEYAAACGLIAQDFERHTPEVPSGFSVEDCDKILDALNKSTLPPPVPTPAEIQKKKDEEEPKKNEDKNADELKPNV